MIKVRRNFFSVFVDHYVSLPSLVSCTTVIKVCSNKINLHNSRKQYVLNVQNMTEGGTYLLGSTYLAGLTIPSVVDLNESFT